jgi:hypothetical protein
MLADVSANTASRPDNVVQVTVPGGSDLGMCDAIITALFVLFVSLIFGMDQRLPHPSAAPKLEERSLQLVLKHQATDLVVSNAGSLDSPCPSGQLHWLLGLLQLLRLGASESF